MSTDQHWFTIDVPGFSGEAVETEVVQRMFGRPTGSLLAMPALRPPAEAFEHVVMGLKDMLDTLSVQVAVRDERLPIGNAVWNRVKAQFHALTVLYVNELAGRQTRINNEIFEAFEALVIAQAAETEQRDRQIRALELEIAHLNEQLKTLKPRQD